MPIVRFGLKQTAYSGCASLFPAGSLMPSGWGDSGNKVYAVRSPALPKFDRSWRRGFGYRSQVLRVLQFPFNVFEIHINA